MRCAALAELPSRIPLVGRALVRSHTPTPAPHQSPSNALSELYTIAPPQLFASHLFVRKTVRFTPTVPFPHPHTSIESPSDYFSSPLSTPLKRHPIPHLPRPKLPSDAIPLPPPHTLPPNAPPGRALHQRPADRRAVAGAAGQSGQSAPRGPVANGAGGPGDAQGRDQKEGGGGAAVGCVTERGQGVWSRRDANACGRGGRSMRMVAEGGRRVWSRRGGQCAWWRREPSLVLTDVALGWWR
eukprot:77340-Chlamydomonas_euryale.AAC.1